MSHMCALLKIATQTQNIVSTNALTTFQHLVNYKHRYAASILWNHGPLHNVCLAALHVLDARTTTTAASLGGCNCPKKVLFVSRKQHPASICHVFIALQLVACGGSVMQWWWEAMAYVWCARSCAKHGTA